MLKKLLYIFIAIAIIGALGVTAPTLAAPESLPPGAIIESSVEPKVKSTYSPPAAQGDPDPADVGEPIEQSPQTVPSTGDIEKNSFQEPYDKSDLKNDVVPKTQNEIMRVGFMFLKVMGAVLLCSGVIYLLLLFVRKNYYREEEPSQETFFEEGKPPKTTPPETAGVLKAPQDENEALKSFLNQTKNR